MFHFYFERKNDKVLTFSIVHFPNFEISASFWLALPSNECWNSQFENLRAPEALIRGNTVGHIEPLARYIRDIFLFLFKNENVKFSYLIYCSVAAQSIKLWRFYYVYYNHLHPTRNRNFKRWFLFNIVVFMLTT